MMYEALYYVFYYATARYTLAIKQDPAFIQDWLYFKVMRYVNIFTKQRFFIQYYKYPKHDQSCYYN